MIEKIDRYYLEILSSDYLKAKSKPVEDLVIELIDPISFELNKFFFDYTELCKDDEHYIHILNFHS